MPFNFLFVLRSVRPHSLSLACNLCYSSCAVCATRSWKDRKTDLENYFMYVISDYRTAVPACLHMVLAVACPGSWGTGVGLSNAVPWGQHGTPVLTQGLASARTPVSESMQLCKHSSCGEAKGSSTRQGSLRYPETTATFKVLPLYFQRTLTQQRN